MAEKNGLLQRQNPVTFLARHGDGRKCSGRACTPVFPPMTSKPSLTDTPAFIATVDIQSSSLKFHGQTQRVGNPSLLYEQD